MTSIAEKSGSIVETSDDDSEQGSGGQDSYRAEIEDIVRGFILEKDIMSQGHEEEIYRIKHDFQTQKADLLRQLEEERYLLRRNPTMTSVGSETGYGSGSHDSEVGHLNLYGTISSGPDGSAARRQISSSSTTASRHTPRDLSDVDNSLVREIAEVYLRMNNGHVKSQVRPDLDIEDKFEREREILERQFLSEKRDLKRKLEEDYNHKLDQERSRYEGNIHELKSTITELQWQTRDLESRIRNEKEKSELGFEREKNEMEKRQMTSIHEYKRKLEERHSVQLVRQKEKYEENISDLQGDIVKLTAQLRELNENLSQEKEIIMAKFEKEIKEIEQTFADQRSTMKFSLESEFSLKLENETSVLKTVNKKLKDDFEALEREKKEVDKKYKEEKRKLEEHYEDEISEMERKYSDEKRSMKSKFEDRYMQMVEKETETLEVTMTELREEVILLRQENSQIEIAFSERNDEIRRQIEMEREESNKKLLIERNELRFRMESEYTQKLISESSGQQEVIQQLNRDLGIMKARCGEVEGAMAAIRQDRDMLARKSEDVHRKLLTKEFELEQRMSLSRNQNDPTEIDKLKELIRQKDNEIKTTNLQKEQTEISMSALKREKIDLEDEIASLKRKISGSSFLPEQRFGSPAVDNSEMVSLHENSRRKDEEVQSMKRDRIDLDARLLSLQRKNDELEDEIAALRRKKLEVEDEISAIKRDKSDSDNQIRSLRREKADLEERMGMTKRKQVDLEDEVSAYKRQKMEVEHEVALLKRSIETMQNEMQIQAQKINQQQQEQQMMRTQDHDYQDGSHSRMPNQTQNQRFSNDSRERHVMPLNEHVHSTRGEITQHNAHELYSGMAEDGLDYADNAIQDIERSIDHLVREKKELEDIVKRLQHEKMCLERDIAQVESKESLSRQQYDQDARQVNEEEVRLIETQKEDLERKITSLKEDYVDLENRISKLRREEDGLEGHVNRLNNETNDLESSLQRLNIEEHRIEKVIEKLQEEKAESQESLKTVQVQNNGRRITSVSQVSIEKVRKHDSKDHELAELRKERDGLKREVTTLKKQLHNSHQERQEEGLQNNITYTKDMKQLEDKEVIGLKKERIQFERIVASLRRQKIEIDAELTVIREVQKREEDALSALRRERMELDIQITTLQSKKTRLDAELSVMRNERKQDDTDVNNLRREKSAAEKLLYDLQSKKSKIEAEISVTEDAWRKKGNVMSGLSSDVSDIERELQAMRNQRVEIQTDISRLQSVRSREEHELTLLRQRKTDLESQISQLKTTDRPSSSSFSTRYADAGHETDGKPAFRSGRDIQKDLGGNTSSPRFGDDKRPYEQGDRTQESRPWDDSNSSKYHPQKVRTSIEITHLGYESPRGSIMSSHASESSMRFGDYGRRSDEQGSDVLSKDVSPRHQVSFTSTEDTMTEPYFRQRDNHSPLYPESEEFYGSSSKYSQGYQGSYTDRETGVVPAVNGNGRHDESYLQRNNYDTACSRYKDDTTHVHQTSFRTQQDGDRIGVSYTSGLSSERGRQNEKEDNDMVFLRREKEELETQISEMRIQLTRLHSEVTEIENKKIILEAIHRRDGVAHMNGHGEFHEELKTEIAHVKTEDKRDSLTQEYENQIRELRERNMELKQRVGLLEWQLENTKQKMEIREMTFRRELSEAKEKYLCSTSDGLVGSPEQDLQIKKLRAFHQHLSYLVFRDINSEQLLREIRGEMNKLQHQKTTVDLKNIHTSDLQTFSSSSDKLGLSTRLTTDEAKAAREYASQLRTQLETADEQLKTCEKIIHRLYAENSDLNKIVLKLEGKVNTSTRSQEKLQRKRALLQKLVERLSSHVDKEQLQQSYLVFELDKDIAI